MRDTEEGKFTVKIISPDLGDLSIGNEDIHLFEMIEDIFSVCMVGKLMFFDRIGSIEQLPITGNEVVTITYGENETTKTFIIYDFKKIHQGSSLTGSAMTMIEMYLVEPIHLTLTQHKYSISWKDKKISVIVKDICKNMCSITQFKNFEEPKEIIPYFYMAYWTPLEALKWLLKRSSGSISGKSGYLLYSNTQGMNCTTIETLFTNTKFEKDESTIAKYVFTDTDNVDSENKILSYSIEPINYQSLSYLSGGHKLGYDFETKSLLDLSYTYSEIISKYTMMGKKTLFQDISSENSQITLEGDNDINILKNIAYGEFIKRYSKQFAVLMMVRGHDRRYAGMMIDIPWKSVSDTEVLHKLYEGKFLVKSITHQFSSKTKPYFRQLIVAIKTGYTDADNKALHKATLYNIVVPKK